MGYFQVRYNSRVIIYNRRAFIRLATGYRVLMMIMTTAEQLFVQNRHSFLSKRTIRGDGKGEFEKNGCNNSTPFCGTTIACYNFI